MSLLYSKSNDMRLPKYAIRTSIIENDGKKLIVKEPIFKEGAAHVERIAQFREKLRTAFPKVKIAETWIEGGKLYGEFIKGKLLSEYYNEYLQAGNKERFLEIVDWHLNLLIDDTKNVCEFIPTAGFKEWFDNDGSDFTGVPALQVSDFDAVSDNIFIVDNNFDNPIFTDYEWCFDFPVPMFFCRYYIIRVLFDRIKDLGKVFTFNELQLRNISEIELQSSEQLVNAFYMKIFSISKKEFKPLYAVYQPYKKTDESVEQIILNKEVHIELLRESERKLDAELCSIKSSRSWRLVQLIWRISRKLIPLGSKRRLFLKIVYKFICHPLRFISKLTPRRIGVFFDSVRREGVGSASRRLDRSLAGTNIESLVLDINPVKMHRITLNDYTSLVFIKQECPAVSIIIPVYNQFEYTYNCLKSILDNTRDIAYEVIIANDCSSDLTIRLEELVKNINVINNKENLRFLKNCNNAARYAIGKFILFLNNDTQVQADWLAPMVKLIEDDPKVGIVGSKLIYSDGTLQEAGGIFWKDGSAWNFGHGSDPALPEFNYVKEVDYVSGASMMIRKELWEQIGGFDELFTPAYCEDADIAFMVRSMGYKVLYQPASVVVHFEGISNGTDTDSGQKAYQVVNQKKFYEKWHDVLEKEHFPTGDNVFQARDRSRFKKKLLMVDHYVPLYDKDAGSRCIFMYLKLFIQMGIKVVFLGDNFYPLQPYTARLQSMGVEVLYGVYYKKNWKTWIQENGKYFDYIYTCRSNISIKYIDIFKKCTNAKIFYFNQDMRHLREYRQYEITGDGKYLFAAEKSEELEMYVSNKADVLHVVGTYEKQILQEKFPQKDIRNIPLYIYENVKEVSYLPEYRKDLLFVGGFGHQPNEDAVLWFFENAFPEIVETIPEIRWFIVGSNPTEKILSIENNHIIVTGYVSEEELEKYYRMCRLCIAPLRFGAGVKGKIVEAAYQCIPMITTPIGAEGLSLDENAFMVCDADEAFADKTISLYGDFSKLKEISANCQKFINNHFSIDSAVEVLRKDMLI
ncbi:hypothetical protein AGMMS49942_21580 [Spirochaetia bacterium]|nr:hypothetical protein AGMMS49942_21580 [Spirochaetia bacterium]